MTKRNLFNELTEGFDALSTEREGKINLHRNTIALRPVLKISADETTASLRVLKHKRRGELR